MKKLSNIVAIRRVALLLSASMLAVLGACGGGGTDPAVPEARDGAALASGITTLEMNNVELPSGVATQTAQPSFHAAPLLLDAPDDTDRIDHAASARMGPRRQSVPSEFRGLSTRRLTVEKIESVRSGRPEGITAPVPDGSVTPSASASIVATYSPAQIRAAYGMPALPASMGSLTAAQAAQLGAGQTIYIVDAMHDPGAAAELAAFNQKFGLPACTTRAIAASASLPLAPASTTGCEFSVVYSTAAGTMTATAPAYDSGWATEIALDVQWTHATAPLARIVLIESSDASLTNLLGAVKLANAMGRGVVSMSFGATEGSWTASVDSAFAGTDMSYFAATGDSGAAVSWPAVSANVLGVGGTTLTYTGSGSRVESAWSGTGGGTSLYTPTPAYQVAAVPGLGTLAHRTVADVAFNADPSTGQYVVVMAPGSSTANWLSVGGTSLSTPQWAGLVAVANAVRAQAARPALGAPHAVLYGQIATVPGSYASVFADIVRGSDGSCATCSARSGYDPLTGLGTPNVVSLIPAVTGAVANPTPPVVTPAVISGTVGTALTFTVSVSAANPVTYALSGAPSGMTIGAAGTVVWAKPVAGSYAVTVVATDSRTGLVGQGLYTVKIVAPTPPVVTGGTVAGKVGTELSFTVSVAASNPVAYSLGGAPAGMTISSAGVVDWPTPLAGTYAVTVVAKDTVSGLTGQSSYAITIAPASAPVVAGGSITGKPGIALSFNAVATGSTTVAYSLAGAPSGMTIGSAGMVGWPSPVLGNYNVTVIARDTKTGLVGQGVYAIRIAASGPTITSAPMNGVAGKPLTGTFTIADPGVSSLSLSISGVPIGMSFSVSGLTFTASWPSPVTGSYLLKLVVVDSAGSSVTATVPVTIAAK